MDICDILPKTTDLHLALGASQYSQNDEAYVAEGLVKKCLAGGQTGQAQACGSSGGGYTFLVIKDSWSKTGSTEEPLIHLRRRRVYHNNENRAFAAVPLIMYNDAFNAFGMSTQVNSLLCMTP